jgi:hypothetical protein
MAYSNEIPANVIPYLRRGLWADDEATTAVLREKEQKVFSEHHARELDSLHDRRVRHAELFELIGYPSEGDSGPVEMDPDRHLLAVMEGLEQFRRDQPGVGTAEIEAFCLSAGLKLGGE